MVSTREVAIVQRRLRVVDRFVAPHVEGPLRLFNQIDSVYDAQPDQGDAPWQLVVGRREQVQTWEDGVITAQTENNSSLIVQAGRDIYAGLGLRNADMDDTEGVLPHTDDAQQSLIGDPPYALPRTKVWRVVGGYLQLHGQVGRAARLMLDSDELLNDSDHPGRWPPVAIDIALSGAGTLSPLEAGPDVENLTNLGPPPAPVACETCGVEQTITLAATVGSPVCPIYATTPAWDTFDPGVGTTCQWRWFDYEDLENGITVDIYYNGVEEYWEIDVSQLVEGTPSAWRASQDPIDPQGSISAVCNGDGTLSFSATLTSEAPFMCDDITAVIS